MPVYEYVCKKCHKDFEVIQTLSEHERVEVSCPKCRSENVERHITHVEAVTSKKS